MDLDISVEECEAPDLSVLVAASNPKRPDFVSEEAPVLVQEEPLEKRQYHGGGRYHAGLLHSRS